MILPNLPRESAFKRAIDPTGASWSPTDYLLADAVDVLAIGNWQRAGDARSAKPKPYPRPADRVVEQTERDQKIAALTAQRDRARARAAQERGEGAG